MNARLSIFAIAAMFATINGCGKAPATQEAKPNFTVGMVAIEKDLVVYEVTHNLKKEPSIKEQRDLFEEVEEYLFFLAKVGDAVSGVNDIRGRVWMPANKHNAWWMRFKPNPRSKQAVSKVDFYQEGNVIALAEFKIEPSKEELTDAGSTVCYLAEGFGRTTLPKGLHWEKLSNTTYKLVP